MSSIDYLSIKEILGDIDGEILLADGFEDALIGYVQGCGCFTVALYDTNKCIEILMEDDMTYEEAWEYFEYNVLGSYVGEKTPLFATIYK